MLFRSIKDLSSNFAYEGDDGKLTVNYDKDQYEKIKEWLNARLGGYVGAKAVRVEVTAEPVCYNLILNHWKLGNYTRIKELEWLN